MNDARIITPKQASAPHARAVADEIAWLGDCIDLRLRHFFAGSSDPFVLPVPPVPAAESALAVLLREPEMTPAARLVLALAVAPHVNSAALDPFYVRNSAIDRIFSEFGGQPAGQGAFMPTAETALFLLAGTDTVARIAAMRLFEPDHPLRRKAGLTLGASGTVHGAVLDLPVQRIIALCDGTPPRPDFTPSFPARRLTTGLGWEDLIVPRAVRDQLEHILAWQVGRRRILDDWGLGRHVGRGFKALFFGPPGTGKTLAATLLGQRTGLDVYRVDLSMVVSKYIGETEKNLGRIFDMAAECDWVLFFDEADALFGARTPSANSNDRYANQEVSYLLQRIEECESLVILASNLRGNIDDAFFRRFQAAVGFSRPSAAERVQLWTGIAADLPLAADVDIRRLAGDHDLTGAAITNVVRHAAISALRGGHAEISDQDLRLAITAEMRKEGRTS
ncbi:ATP-binding protein [Paracoccus marinaquae]|uniref:ATP-binding protein n=1 Tax=Paracoccus marinaquae TaxID=2841926 RepID=A0ABS6AJP3_9RHOB|nr:ATP-binding protein [Paracoccus marinaquae]MBU3030127.1 ATP-binding protein [Paracoccus marinaquae]